MHELIERREKAVEGHTEQICKLTQDLLLWCRTRAAGSIAGGSPRARPAWRAICLYEAAAESACRQYRAVRWFLLPEAELRPRGRQRIANMAWRSNGNLGRSAAFTEIFDYESLAKIQCPQVPAILPNVGAIGSAKTALQTPAVPFSQNRLLLSLTPSSSVMNNCRRARAAGSSAEGSPREYQAWRTTLFMKPRRSRPAGSIGSRGGSYCRRSGSVRGWAAGQPGIHHNGKPGLQIRANMTVDCKSAAAQSSHNDAQSMLKFSSPSGMA